MIIQPSTTASLAFAVAGESVGGWLCDIDVRGNENKCSVIEGAVLLVFLIVVLIVVDFVARLGIASEISKGISFLSIAGLTLFLVAAIFGVRSSHRTFTHSLLVLVAFSVATYLIASILAALVAIGITSHILLDLFNKKGEALLFPWRKGFCFNLLELSQSLALNDV